MSASGRPKKLPLPRGVQVSKKLSWLLRHGAEKEGLKLDSNGYVDLADVLANRNIKSLKVTLQEVLDIVKDNDKQRFALILDPAKFSSPDQNPTTHTAGDYLIRANQGHSIKVEDSGLLTPITKENAPAMAVHGTTHAKWLLISSSGGLKPMDRNHVHFASGLPQGFKNVTEDGQTVSEAPVISGMRSKSSVLIYLSIDRALDAGLQLGLSANGVILTPGNAEGLVPLELFDRVEDRTSSSILLEDGKVVKGPPAARSRTGNAEG